jgi:hypothetical protein
MSKQDHLSIWQLFALINEVKILTCQKLWDFHSFYIGKHYDIIPQSALKGKNLWIFWWSIMTIYLSENYLLLWMRSKFWFVRNCGISNEICFKICTPFLKCDTSLHPYKAKRTWKFGRTMASMKAFDELYRSVPLADIPKAYHWKWIMTTNFTRVRRILYTRGRILCTNTGLCTLKFLSTRFWPPAPFLKALDELYRSRPLVEYGWLI